MAACTRGTDLAVDSAYESPGPRAVVAPAVGAPEVVGELAGPKAIVQPAGLRVYGTDMGLSYEHRGQTYITFGDTWPYAKFICDEHAPHNDDTVATMPDAYAGGVPLLDWATEPDDPLELREIQVFRGEQSLMMGYGKTPLTLWSDGDHVFGIFGRVDWTRCDAGACASDAAFECAPDVGECEPGFWETPLLCDPATREPCLLSQVCNPSPSGFCVDTSSSQYDGSPRGNRAAVVQNLELAMQRGDDPTRFDSVLVYQSNKFGNPIARTVKRWSGRHAGNDYRTGSDTLLMWSRPGFLAEEGREAQLYLLTHALPLKVGADGKLNWQPRYFAGLEPATHEPRWSDRQADAAPIALDGQVGGSPHEEINILQQMTISWLGPPVNRFIMMYGGDEVNEILLDDQDTRDSSPLNAAISIRFADHPWGPWSPPTFHYGPGRPDVVGDAYGPGGVLFHYACKDTANATCARTDAPRPLESFIDGCPILPHQMDIGRFYCPNIIEAYTKQNTAGGLDVFWNVSAWNPYAVVLLKTTVEP